MCKKTLKVISIIIILLLAVSLSYSQGVAINNDGSSPHVSAMLDVTSTNSGILVPRMTMAERDAIVSPANSLLIFQTDNSTGFYYNSGTAASPNWKALSASSSSGVSDADGDTKIQVEESTDEDIIRFDVEGTEKWVMEDSRLEAVNNGHSVFIGEEAGVFDDLTTNNNVGIGYQALYKNTNGYQNTAIGSLSMFNNTTGEQNTAYGYGSLNANSDGQQNTAIGYAALEENEGGDANIALGYHSLHSNVGNNNSIAIGYFAMRYADNRATTFKTTYNIAIGSNALRGGDAVDPSNNSGTFNIAMGNIALQNITYGSNNTGIGYRALGSLSTGYRNTAIGNDAGNNTATGDNNCTFVGASASSSATFSITNSTAIGYQATVTNGNQIAIGNTSVTSIKGQVAFSTYSDARFKTNVQENVSGLDFIMKLRPVTYNVDINAMNRFYNIDEDKDLNTNTIHTGFIAQEVEEAAKSVNFDFHGVDKPQNEESHYSLRYAEFVVPLVKSVQEQQNQIEQLKLENKEMKEMIIEQQQMINQLIEK